LIEVPVLTIAGAFTLVGLINFGSLVIINKLFWSNAKF